MAKNYNNQEMMEIRSNSISIDFLRRVLLRNNSPYVKIKNFNNVKEVLFMDYMLNLGMEAIDDLLATFGIDFEIESDAISFLYYIFVNNREVSLINPKNINAKQYTFEEHKIWVKTAVKDISNYDTAAILFHGIFGFSPFYDINRMIEYKESKIFPCDYLTVYKFFNAQNPTLVDKTLQNPVSTVKYIRSGINTVKDEKSGFNRVIHYLNTKNYIFLAELYGLIYPANVVGSDVLNYILYFVQNFDPAILLHNRTVKTQIENILSKSYKYGEKNEIDIISNFGQVLTLIKANVTNINSNLKGLRKDLPFTEDLKNYVDSKSYKFSQSEKSVLNTAKYLYYKIRSGIYCEIKNNTLVKFFIFVNPNYNNKWKSVTFRGLRNYKNKTLEEIHKLKPQNDLSLEEYSKFKSFYLSLLNKKNIREENYLPIEKWWCNAFLIDNVLKKYPDSPIIGTSHCQEIMTLLLEVCNGRKVKDCKFFINKRDHPVLKEDLSFPYDFLNVEKNWMNGIGKTFAPILSWTGSNDFQDILIPNVDDISSAINYSHENIGENDFPKIWEDREDKAIFLGSTTGPPRSKNNQRVQLSKLIKENPDVLEGGITLVNYRDKVEENNLVEFTIEPIEIVNKMPMLDQTYCKYAINVDGHAAAYRTSVLHYLKFLVFRVDSLPSREYIGELWVDKIFKEGEDYVKIKYDMSDLVKKIKYYAKNDELAMDIVNNASDKVINELNMGSMVDYMCYLFNSFR